MVGGGQPKPTNLFGLFQIQIFAENIHHESEPLVHENNIGRLTAFSLFWYLFSPPTLSWWNFNQAAHFGNSHPIYMYKIGKPLYLLGCTCRLTTIISTILFSHLQHQACICLKTTNT
jgi:hypothetical protein